MKTTDRALLLAEIAGKHPNTGKTAIMKFAYLLQTLYDVPFGYEFEIYTYGPFSQTVMSDLEFAEFSDYIDIKPIQYDSYSGYCIDETSDGKECAAKNHEFLDCYESQILKVLDFFGNKNAKQLELYSTVVFVAKSTLLETKKIDKVSICRTVQEIKPHFSAEVISQAFVDLERGEMLSKLSA